MTFGEKLASLRKERGMTPKELASEIRVNVQVYYNYETDIATPSLRRCGMICRALNIKPEDLFKEVEL